MAALKDLKVVQTRSVIGQEETMRLTLKGLGLRGPGSSVTVKNTPSFRGAIKKVIHLVTVEEVDG
ncbi:50S ribosomal protein L30 [Pendulispora brunnea]|uniref:50S ribosomal protein L30 n=1 Tax=Pendulispora brunnea TaxID=2905690 RepID=A0ABZ2K0R8_9BACT